MFAQFKAQLHTDTPFFQVCHFLGVPKLQKEQDTTQQPLMLQSYSKQEMAPQTVLYSNLKV
jgi:hypothetical protein